MRINNDFSHYGTSFLEYLKKMWNELFHFDDANSQLCV